MNRKGFMRVVEATIAILLIFGVLIVVASQRTVPEKRDLSGVIPPVLDELAQNFSLREKVVALNKDNEENTEQEIKLAMEENIDNPSFEYEVEICDLGEVCYLEDYPNTEEEIFTSERVISSSIKNESFSPKRVKVFLWRK